MAILNRVRFMSGGSPEITLNPEGYISIRGRSVNGEVNELDNMIREWINNYLADPSPVTVVEFSLDYFNRINSRLFISMLKQLDTLRQNGRKLIVNWYYEEGDEEIHDKGESFSKALDIPFNYIETCDILMPELSHVSLMLSA